MDRRRSHLLVDTIEQPDKTTRRVGLCGSDAWFDSFETEEQNVSCADCSRLIAEKVLAAHAKAGTRLKMETVKLEGYRTAYRALIGDGDNLDHVGFIVMEGAFANARWYVRKIGLRTDDLTIVHVGDQVAEERKTGRYVYPIKFRSKEAALAAVPDLMAKGELRTHARQVKSWRDAQARHERREAADAAERAAAAKSKADCVLGLKMLDADKGLDLSNFQRDAVHVAIKLLTEGED